MTGRASLRHGFGASTTGGDIGLLLKILLCLVCALAKEELAQFSEVQKKFFVELITSDAY